jgi:hypothetical protein
MTARLKNSLIRVNGEIRGLNFTPACSISASPRSQQIRS